MALIENVSFRTATGAAGYVWNDQQMRVVELWIEGDIDIDVDGIQVSHTGAERQTWSVNGNRLPITEVVDLEDGEIHYVIDLPQKFGGR